MNDKQCAELTKFSAGEFDALHSLTVRPRAKKKENTLLNFGRKTIRRTQGTIDQLGLFHLWCALRKYASLTVAKPVGFLY
jgi:hypothetical protein